MAIKRRQTTAEIVDEVRATPPSPLHVRSGTFNSAGEFFDPSGALLTRANQDISEADAANLLARGARVVSESCGCGGGGDCVPIWADNGGLDRPGVGGPPRLVKEKGSPTWIDHWTAPTGDVVFLHGYAPWGDAG